MSGRLTELAGANTPMGDISLRVRLDPTVGVPVYEAKLDDEFLMSSLFTVAEVALASLGLAEASATRLDVAVGGLGLGYTACAVLQDPRVQSVVVVEALDEVIDWHRRGLLPDADGLAMDGRVRLVAGDFFALTRSGAGFDPGSPGRRFDVILLDVDHTPTHLLHPSHADLYEAAGLSRLACLLNPGGVFGLWSDDPPHDAVTAVLASVFESVIAHVVTFANPLTGGESSNTVYVASVAGPDAQPVS